jgi:hypothetical protein
LFTSFHCGRPARPDTAHPAGSISQVASNRLPGGSRGHYDADSGAQVVQPDDSCDRRSEDVAAGAWDAGTCRGHRRRRRQWFHRAPALAAAAPVAGRPGGPDGPGGVRGSHRGCGVGRRASRPYRRGPAEPHLAAARRAGGQWRRGHGAHAGAGVHAVRATRGSGRDPLRGPRRAGSRCRRGG